VIIAGCGGRAPLKDPVLFYNPSARTEVADFVVLRHEGAEMSFEILGNSKWLSDTSCRIFLQIGTYKTPNFVEQKLHIFPDSVSMNSSGGPVQKVVAGGGQSNGKPYDWLTMHQFLLTLPAPIQPADTVRYLPVKIYLDGYAQYEGQPVPIDTVKGYVRLKDR
jgi:hypothetical protein